VRQQCPLSGIGLNSIISSYSEVDATTFARDKFGGQKAISSDMYFGRNDYDPHVVNEAQTRLQSFQGASSISSSQYFGREEEEDDLGGPRSTEGLLGDGSLAGLESAARDAYSRLLANPDVQNMGDSIRSGALKVCTPPSLISGLVRWGTYLSDSYLTT